jgi:WD40 repeat protein
MAPEASRAVLGVIALVVGIGTACGSPAPSAQAPSSASQGPAASSIVTPSSPIASAEPTSAPSLGGPIASTGSIAVLRANGSLSIVDASGRSVTLSDATDGTFGFPTWSPDGSRIATVRHRGADASLVVFDANRASPGPLAEPVEIFRKTAVVPFYLFWTPDGTAVSFLASEAGDISLRLAPADGSAPLDGSGRGAKVRAGNPFYYDWIQQDRLLAHIGIGTDGFLGEIGLDGKAAGAPLGTAGDFRSAVVSRDRKSIAFVRSASSSDEIVVSARNGSSEHATPVFGTAAVVFGPAGDTVASIGPIALQPPAGFPLGPLRLIDAGTGEVRTLIDGFVASAWWSPDGKTMAALRVQPAIGSGSAASDAPSPATPDNEVRLLFVDVAAGKVRSQPVVSLGPTFVNGILAYFDQYALSHRMWAPDSSSILIPEAGADGVTRLTVRFPDGEDPLAIDGEIGFWSP